MRNEALEYLEHLCRLFGPATLDVLLIKTVSILYPALTYAGISLEAPLLVVAQNEQQVRALLAVLQGYGLPTVVTLAEKPKIIRKSLEEIPYGLRIFRHKSGRYLLENLEQLVQKMVEIDISVPLKQLVIIIAVGSFPARYRDQLAGTIYLYGEGYADYGHAELPEIERPFILHWLENGWQRPVFQTGDSLEIFWSALAFLVDFFRTNRCNEAELEGLKDALDETLNKIQAAWDTPGDPNEYAEMFRVALFQAIDWLPRPIFDRGKVEGVAIEDLHLQIYYDQSSYYLPPRIFEKVCQPLVGDAGFEQMKGLLADAEILISGIGGSGRNYFTPKVELITAMGYRERVRMIRLARNKVDLPGDLSFKEIMGTKGGGFDDQNQ